MGARLQFQGWATDFELHRQRRSGLSSWLPLCSARFEPRKAAVLIIFLTYVHPLFLVVALDYIGSAQIFRRSFLILTSI
jgi:hypothetical protein